MGKVEADSPAANVKQDSREYPSCDHGAPANAAGGHVAINEGKKRGDDDQGDEEVCSADDADNSRVLPGDLRSYIGQRR